MSYLEASNGSLKEISPAVAVALLTEGRIELSKEIGSVRIFKWVRV